MSWDLVARLQERFPEIEPFPHGSDHTDAAHPAEAVPGKPAPKHEARAYLFHTPGAYVPAARILEICQVLRDDEPFHLDYCSFVSAVDRPPTDLEVVYHLFSMTAHHEILLKARVPRDAPRLPSVSGLWPGANWHEREAYDLFGVVFDGHPDLRRIMMTEDWQGYPLRKDYVYQEPRWLVDLATQRQREIEGLGLGERA
jgi:NADH/F420H2 dehydrogenase subunit C